MVYNMTGNKFCAGEHGLSGDIKHSILMKSNNTILKTGVPEKQYQKNKAVEDFWVLLCDSENMN